MILPNSVLFSFIVSLDRYSITSVCALDTNPLCPVTFRSAEQCYGDNEVQYECRVGTKSYSQIFPEANIEVLNSEYGCTGSNCMYCDCEESNVQPGDSGVTGKNCDIEFTLCADNEQVCFHGAPCISAGNEYVCGCPYTSDPDKKFVGSHCEFEADTLCHTNDASLTDISKSGEWFCTNKGECIDDATDLEEKCQCDPGYYGLHCEYTDEQPECELECENRGICNSGVKDYSYYDDDALTVFLTDDDDGYDEPQTLSYCVCPVGYTGITCQREVVDCGNGVCFNGATCKTGLAGHYCDCSNVDVTGPDGELIPHAGASCETLATTMCDATINFPGIPTTEYFCTNGGSCPEDLHKPCNCPYGFNGPKCEFEDVTANVYPKTICNFPGTTMQQTQYFCANGGICPENRNFNCVCAQGFSGAKCETEDVTANVDQKKICSLQCENGGTCFFGDAPETSLYNDFDITSLNPLSGRHCRCPPGYAGFLCENEIEICGESEHHCQNRGKCVQDNSNWKCDCMTNSTNTKIKSYAGENCESASTSFCVGPGSSKEFFCTNEGVCVDQVLAGTTTHPGCTCNNGYHGQYCEFKEIRKNIHGTASKAFLGFTITLFGLFAIFLTIYYTRAEQKRRPAGVERVPIGIPPDININTRDCDSGYDNTLFMD